MEALPRAGEQFIVSDHCQHRTVPHSTSKSNNVCLAAENVTRLVPYLPYSGSEVGIAPPADADRIGT